MKSLLFIISFSLLAVGLSGCEARTYKLTGTITTGGEKLTWPEGGTLLVIYFPEDRKKNTNVYKAQTDTATSTYEIEAIPAGRYKVAVQQFDTKHMDSFGGAYDPSHTTLLQEVTEGTQAIDIDIPRREPSKSPNRKGKGAEGKKE